MHLIGGGRAVRDESAAQTCEARKRRTCDTLVQDESFDERSCKLRTIAVEALIALGGMGYEFMWGSDGNPLGGG